MVKMVKMVDFSKRLDFQRQIGNCDVKQRSVDMENRTKKN